MTPDRRREDRGAPTRARPRSGQDVAGDARPATARPPPLPLPLFDAGAAVPRTPPPTFGVRLDRAFAADCLRAGGRFGVVTGRGRAAARAVAAARRAAARAAAAGAAGTRGSSSSGPKRTARSRRRASGASASRGRARRAGARAAPGWRAATVGRRAGPAGRTPAAAWLGGRAPGTPPAAWGFTSLAQARRADTSPSSHARASGEPRLYARQARRRRRGPRGERVRASARVSLSRARRPEASLLAPPCLSPSGAAARPRRRPRARDARGARARRHGARRAPASRRAATRPIGAGGVTRASRAPRDGAL